MTWLLPACGSCFGVCLQALERDGGVLEARLAASCDKCRSMRVHLDEFAELLGSLGRASHSDQSRHVHSVAVKLQQAQLVLAELFHELSHAAAQQQGTSSDSLKKGKGSPCSITERRVPELIPVLGSQPAGDVSHKPGGWLPFLSTRPAVTPATLKRAATNFVAW